MKKLELSQLESLQAGGPGECADFVIGAAKGLVTDPIFFLVYYDPYINCL